MVVFCPLKNNKHKHKHKQKSKSAAHIDLLLLGVFGMQANKQRLPQARGAGHIAHVLNLRALGDVCEFAVEECDAHNTRHRLDRGLRKVGAALSFCRPLFPA